VFGYIFLCKLLALLNVLLSLVGSDLFKMVVGIKNRARTRARDRQEEEARDAQTEEEGRTTRIGHTVLL
jgi:hypothetical protein